MDLAAHMSPEHMRLRFLAAMRGLSHELAARLSHIHPDRDVALFAFAEVMKRCSGSHGFPLTPTTALPNSPSRCEPIGNGTGLATC